MLNLGTAAHMEDNKNPKDVRQRLRDSSLPMSSTPFPQGFSLSDAEMGPSCGQGLVSLGDARPNSMSMRDLALKAQMTRGPGQIHCGEQVCKWSQPKHEWQAKQASVFCFFGGMSGLIETQVLQAISDAAMPCSERSWQMKAMKPFLSQRAAFSRAILLQEDAFEKA